MLLHYPENFARDFSSDVRPRAVSGHGSASVIRRGATPAIFERRHCPEDVTVQLGLIHAHASSQNAPLLALIFRDAGWMLFGPD